MFLAPVSSGSFSKNCVDGRLSDALQAVASMEQQGILVPSDIFFTLLQRCMEEKDLATGKELCLLIGRGRFASDPFLGCWLIRMFALFERLPEANEVFNKILKPNVFAWSAIISAHAKLGQPVDAIHLYQLMQKAHLEPDGHVFAAVLKSCASVRAIVQGTTTHIHIVEVGLESDAFVGNTLIHMYVNCGSLSNAEMVFNRLPRRDVVTWSALIAGHVDHGQGEEALQLFQQMEQEGLQPDNLTYVHLLKACSSISALEEGKRIHSRLMETGVKLDLFISSTLIDMYAKCGRLEDARLLFDRLPACNLVTWSALIGGYAQQGHGRVALHLFQQMQSEGLKPDKVMLVSLLQACASIAALKQGKQIHMHIIESGIELDLVVGNILIDMYGKCASLEDAHMVFDNMSERDVVTWSALMEGYTLHGQGRTALQLFEQMQDAHVDPNRVTYACLLKACSSVAALQQGKLIHMKIVDCGLESHLFIGSALIDMYANCGCLAAADTVFNRLPKHDVVTWSALIAGYAQHNNYAMASKYLEIMLRKGVEPNGVTFLCLLSACSRAGLVQAGCAQFMKMRDELRVELSLDHQNSLVDLLGGGGHLREAEDLLETLPFQSNIVGWTSLLGSCKKHGDIDLGRHCFEQLVTFQDASATGYVLMSSIYAHAGMLCDAENIEQMRKHANVWKKPANAFIEVDNRVHDFRVGDNAHPRIEAVREKLKALSSQMWDEGYKPQLDLVLDSISDKKKEEALFGHSEKLAMAFGLLSLPSGTTIRVAKNLRMCVDCHNFAKVLSKVERREIYVTDAYCVHNFTDGACCCNGCG